MTPILASREGASVSSVGATESDMPWDVGLRFLLLQIKL